MNKKNKVVNNSDNEEPTALIVDPLAPSLKLRPRNSYAVSNPSLDLQINIQQRAIRSKDKIIIIVIVYFSVT
jgi:hypothetical protein